MEIAKRAFFAVVGAGDLVLEKIRGMFGTEGRNEVSKAYGDLARRGQRLVDKLGRSQPVKRAVDGTRQARKQVKGAVTSVRKAAFGEKAEGSRKAS